MGEVLEYCDKYNFELFMDNKINLNQLKTKIYNKLGCNYVCADDLE